MQSLVIAARLPRRHITARLKVDLPISAAAELTGQEVELPAPDTVPARDDGVALETPARRRRGAGGQFQRLVRCAVAPDRQIRCSAVHALNRTTADLEVLAAGLGAHHGDRGCSRGK